MTLVALKGVLPHPTRFRGERRSSQFLEGNLVGIFSNDSVSGAVEEGTGWQG